MQKKTYKFDVSALPIDAHEVCPGMFQGSKPVEGDFLKKLGFDALVLCAEEWQPDASRFRGLSVIHAPNDDDPSRLPTRDELRVAVHAARDVALRVSRGEVVLVTCWQGWNRSGLVSALALHILTGAPGGACSKTVQSARPGALCNPRFREVLKNLPPGGRDVLGRLQRALTGSGKTG